MDQLSISSTQRENRSTSHSNDYSYSSDYTYEYPYSTAWLAIVPLVVSVISVVTVVGNIMVIVAYFRDPRIRANVANLFILNLSITDLIVGAIVWTLNYSWVIKDYWVHGEIICKLWSILDYTVVTVSVLTLVLISWDRYCLLTMGMRYQTFQTKKRVGLIISITWLIDFIWYSTLAFAFGPITGKYSIDYTEDCEMEFTANFAMTTVVNVFLFYIPFPVLIMLNIAVYANIKRRSRGIVGQSPATNPLTQSTVVSQDQTGESTRPGNLPLSDRPAIQGQVSATGSSNATPNAAGQTVQTQAQRGAPAKSGLAKTGSKTEERTFAKHRKAAVVLGLLVGCFLLCWLPYQVSSIMFAICGYDCVSILTWEVTNSLVWINSTINPFIYAATNVHFRRNFQHFLLLDRWACDIKRCKVKCKP